MVPRSETAKLSNCKNACSPKNRISINGLVVVHGRLIVVIIYAESPLNCGSLNSVQIYGIHMRMEEPPIAPPKNPVQKLV
jgi:hypothetical protein